MSDDAYFEIVKSRESVSDPLVDLVLDDELSFVYADYDEDGITLSSLDGDNLESNELEVKSESSTLTTTDTNEGSDLLTVLKNKDRNLTSHIKEQSDLIKKQNDLLYEQNILSNKILAEKVKSNEINSLLVDEMIKSNKINIDANKIMATDANARDFHNSYATAKNAMSLDKMDIELYGSDNIVDDNGNSIIPIEEQARYYSRDLSKSISEQNDLISKQNELIKAGNDSNAISRAIGDQTDSQKEYYDNGAVSHSLNSKKLNFEINGSPNVKDTNGDQIIPMETQAKYHAEKHIDEKRANETDSSSFFDDLLDDLTKIIDDTVDTATTDPLDNDDDSNIMSYVLDQFTKDYDFTNIPNNLVEDSLSKTEDKEEES